MTEPRVDHGRALLADLYRAAVRGAAAGPALRAALAELAPPGRPVWILALGKAAVPMASAAAGRLREWGADPAGGLIVCPAGDAPPAAPGGERPLEARAGAAPDGRIEQVAGDHPEPGPRSFAAARRLEEVVARIRPDDEVWVLLSGGATSLAAGPADGIPPGDLARLSRLLLASGLDVAAMNRIRKRFFRWGAGRLAAALAPARVRTYVVSDVIGDDLASIGSGPCVPDETTAGDVRSLLASAGLWDRIPPSMRTAIDAAERDSSRETPKPGDPRLRGVDVRVVAGNRRALEAAADRARSLGVRPAVQPEPLSGEAAEAGRRIGRALRSYCGDGSSQPPAPRCLIWGGETTVTLGESPGRGGRCQELALAAARELEGAGPGTRPAAGPEDRVRGAGAGPALLAAGTDGRDGPTDAAGAIVDGGTWARVRAAGRDPVADLERHDAYAALEAAGDLLRTGPTGTNVMDVVIGLCPGARASGAAHERSGHAYS